MKKGIVVGALLIVAGLGLFAYYDLFIKSESEAQELLVQARMMYERGSRDAVNNSIHIFSRIIAKYPKTKAASEAYYYIGNSYEKLGLNRLAYLKYLYLLKNNRPLDGEMDGELRARLAKLRVMRRHTEEGIHQLLSLLKETDNREFRSRIYAELGHAYLNNGVYWKSKKMFDISLSEDGSNEEAILGKARAYKRLGQNNKAYDLYEYFLTYFGNFSRYTSDVRSSFIRQVYSSGYDSYQRGAYYDAISYFARLLRLYPHANKSENALFWAGMSYGALKKYDNALKYYTRVLSNGYYHKDQDARMNRGYLYFKTGKFDLAAREFQVYIDNYPHGRFIEKARKWKRMSAREIQYRVRSSDRPEQDYDDEYRDDDGEPWDNDRKDNGDNGDKDSDDDTRDSSKKDGTTGAYRKIDNGGIDFENVAEL